ncbi:MAG: haloacid dehalogenase type II [Planctomycetes bacterium]|nr:haloacid dehalogenase type II [Planctomycetota bacterium]
MVLEVTRIRALTFDCYGTLIDWDKGIRAALKTVKGLAGVDVERLLREREQAEFELLAGPYRIYSGVLGDSLRTAAAAQGRALHYGEILGLVNTMSLWPTFPDAGKVLRRLAVNYTLAILSNVETKVLQTSVKQIGAPFVALVTAEDIHSYKPAPKHWEIALKRLHQPKENILHVAGSLQHDIRPARALGFATAWINRRNEPVPDDLDPAAVFPDLGQLMETLLGPATVG